MLPWLFALWVSAAPAPPSPPAQAQFIARAWGTADGLPQNTVTSIVQTRYGYLWVGTFGGLVRFDGHAFTVFNPANAPGLASGRVVKLLEDRRGVLWIGTEAGLTKYYAGRFTTYRTSDGLPHDEITALLDDRDGRLWIATVGGLARFDGRAFQRVPDGPLHGVGQAIAQTGDGDVWVATGEGVGRFHGDGEPSVVDRQSTTALLTDAKGRLWIGGTDLRVWDPAADSGRGRFTLVSQPGPFATRGIVTAIAEDSAGTLWIGTAAGGVYTWRDGSVTPYTVADGLSDNVSKAVTPDSGGNIWIGTNIGGLNRLKQRRVFSYPIASGAAYSIAPIVDDGAGGLWMGEICGGVRHFRAGRFEPFAGQRNLPGCVWALYRDPDGTLWIGSMGGGVGRFRDGRYTSFREEGRHSLVSAITRDHNGVMWIGSDAGLSRFEDGTYTDYGREAGIDQRVLTIYEDRSGALWIGSVKGLFRFADGRFTRYSKEQGLSHDLVRAIHEDADGVMWIGTYGGGLNRFENGRFVSYGIDEGLPDVAVSRIIEDPQGYLWMSGNKGIFRVARSQLNEFAKGRQSSVTGVTYGMADGMVTDETNGGQPAGWRTPNGHLWFPTIKGLVEIDPVTDPARPPRVVVERSVVSGRAAAVASLQSLGPGNVDVEFHYTAIDLGAGEKTRFRYRLTGYDEKWIDSGTRRVAYYTKIAPGDYHFEVMATDADGGWSTTPARIAVAVIPHWWQRREAFVAGVFLMMAMTGSGVRHVSLRRARARVAELEREQAIERERSRIARDLHDDLGSRLAQIALIAEDPSGPSPERISNVAREAMRTMDELVWTVNARNDTVEKFAEFAAEFAEEHLSLAGVRYRLQIQPDLEGRRLDADTRRHLFLAFKEAIHNLVKHAGASEVHIALGVEGATLELEITDNGRGLPPGAAAGTGNGLLNMRERMAAAGGTFDIGPADGGGTRVVFRAPVGGEAAAGQG